MKRGAACWPEPDCLGCFGVVGKNLADVFGKFQSGSGGREATFGKREVDPHVLHGGRHLSIICLAPANIMTPKDTTAAAGNSLVSQLFCEVMPFVLT